MRILQLCLLIAAVDGCTSAEIDGPITYLPAGGFTGQGDGTSELHVDLDGTVARPKMGGGAETATLDSAMLDDLHGKILDAQFPALEPQYTCPCADDFVYAVSVQIDGEVHMVTAHSLAPPPARLKIVIDTLGSISQAPLDWH